MFRKTTIIKGLIILLVIGVLATLGWAGLKKVRERQTEENKETIKQGEYQIVKKRAKKIFSRINYIQKLEIPFLRNLLKNHNIWVIGGYIGNFPYPSEEIIATDKHGRFFALPEEFNNIINAEKMRIEDKEKALELAKLYILIVKGGGYKYSGNEILFLQKATDIPPLAHWREYIDSKDPKNYTEAVKEPQVLFKEGVYYVEFYTWESIRGKITHWLFKIKINGSFDLKKTEVADRVGNFIPYIFE